MNYSQRILLQLQRATCAGGLKPPRLVVVAGSDDLMGGGLGLGVGAILAEAGGLSPRTEAVESHLQQHRSVVLASGRGRTVLPRFADRVVPRFRWPDKVATPDLYLVSATGKLPAGLKDLLAQADSVCLFMDGSAVSSGINEILDSPLWPLLSRHKQRVVPCVHFANFFSLDALPKLYTNVYLEALKRLRLPGRPEAFFLSEDRNPGYQALFQLQKELYERGGEPIPCAEAFELLRRQGLPRHRTPSSPFHPDNVEEVVGQVYDQLLDEGE